MPNAKVMQVVLRELIACGVPQRVVEPALIMDDPAQVAAFVQAGREDGVMAPVHLYHCANICEVIHAGDVVLDLGCGPANQLTMVARFNPEVRFIGVDLSLPMLEQAAAQADRLALRNIHFQHADISDLVNFATESIDAVISTVALHHLPDRAALEKTFAGIARVLRPGGGVYLVDFGHLKSESSIDYFAHQYADRQPESFTLDYLNSLRAAFALDDFRAASVPLATRARLYSTFLIPYLVALKSAPRRAPDPALRARLAEVRARLPAWHQADLADLCTFFRLGGLKCALL